MRKDELTSDFIARQRSNCWGGQQSQLDYLEKLSDYINKEVPGLPESYDGDAYAIYWELNGKTFWADCFDYCFLWIYIDKNNKENSCSWDQEDVDEPVIPSDVAIKYIKKLLEK